MRLLETVTLRLVEFGGGDIPPYAILSHTWGEEEVTFQHISGSDDVVSLGYEKIKKTCAVAAENGFEYVWIDTCCIDKASSAELSEAINSMYHWYHEADVCYAYLADVSSIDDFPQGRWFRRGWTLQELIAPLDVVFLDHQWREIGTKSSLRQQVSEITGIPVRFLLGGDLDEASVAQRMSWASKRETTRVEDLAYCLMGIFNIHMPLLYGEGERSFIRLQEEIMRFADDYSLFAWKSLESRGGGLLATSPAAFVNSGNIVFKPSGISREALTVNNQGIHLELRCTDQGHQGLHLAILPDVQCESTSRKIALYIRAKSQAKDYFERERSDSLEFLDLTERSWSNTSAKRICVRNDRLTRNGKQRNNPERCEVKLVGMYNDITQHQVHLQSIWTPSSDGVLLSTAIPTSDGIFGGLLVVCKDGTWFQVRLESKRQRLSVSIETELVPSLERSQGPTVHHASEFEPDRITKPFAAGRRIVLAIKRQLRFVNGQHYRVALVEIQCTSSEAQIVGADELDHIALLEKTIEDPNALLSYAASQGLETMARELLTHTEVAAELRDEDRMMSLSLAAKRGHEGIVKLLLLAYGDDALGMTDTNQQTPLSLAAAAGHLTVVKLLLAYENVRVNTKDKDGRTPLCLAAAEGHEAIVQLLLSHGDDAGADITDITGKSPLLLASARGHEAVVKLLLVRDGVNANAKDRDGQTPLIAAAAGGHGEVVEFLLARKEIQAEMEKGCQLSRSLEAATANGHSAVVKLLQAHTSVRAASPDKEAWTSLCLAAAGGHEEVVELLLAQGVKANASGETGQTPLLLAAAGGHEAAAQLLLSQDNVDINAKDQDGRTPLLAAAAGGYDAVVKLLLACGHIKADLSDHLGMTPLSIAATGGQQIEDMKPLLGFCWSSGAPKRIRRIRQIL
ncbi:hypothetical protein MFIFM68171_07386 [Madurella fahalii]|uniref:Heterokaryon incompatibility domain-containing protein n=1 Tax=Madurella fahalii TaxID=1157608 RepID=A0ABQ0GHD7_9PEZI